MNVRFPCPGCDRPGRLELPGSDWQCTACDHLVTGPRAARPESLASCLLCGNHELYKKKDFPHGLGLAILMIGCLASAIPYWLYMQWLVWTILIGLAVFDGILFLCVSDVIVCYRCNAHYRGFVSSEEHKPFELGTGERYRQERLRREQLQPGRKPG